MIKKYFLFQNTYWVQFLLKLLHFFFPIRIICRGLIKLVLILRISSRINWISNLFSNKLNIFRKVYIKNYLNCSYTILQFVNILYTIPRIESINKLKYERHGNLGKRNPLIIKIIQQKKKFSYTKPPQNYLSLDRIRLDNLVIHTVSSMRTDRDTDHQLALPRLNRR